MQRNKQGIFGGTFDPIHLGHVRLIETLLAKTDLNSIRIIPCHIPPHRPTPHATAQQRLDMLRLATDHLDERVIIDDYEIQQDKTSYTINTIEHLQKTYPNTDFVLIMGMDAWNGFPQWHHAEEILQKVDILVVARQGLQSAPSAPIATNDLHKISFFTDFDLPISATEIRQCLLKQQNCQTVLPPAVLTYIQSNCLYQTE